MFRQPKVSKLDNSMCINKKICPFNIPINRIINRSPKKKKKHRIIMSDSHLPTRDEESVLNGNQSISEAQYT